MNAHDLVIPGFTARPGAASKSVDASVSLSFDVMNSEYAVRRLELIGEILQQVTSGAFCYVAFRGRDRWRRSWVRPGRCTTRSRK